MTSSVRLFLNNIQNTGINKEYWMKDEKVKECYDCKQPFNTFRRKHHCRICGQIFCHKCASSIVSGERFGFNAEMSILLTRRVCNFCLKIMEEYRPDSNSLDRATRKIDDQSTNRLRSASISFPIPPPNMIPPSSPRAVSRPASNQQDEHEPSSLDNFRKIIGSSFFKTEAKSPKRSKVSAPFRRTLETLMPQSSQTDDTMGPYITDDDEYGQQMKADEWQPSPFLDTYEPMQRLLQLPEPESYRRTSFRDPRVSVISTYNRQALNKVALNAFLSSLRMSSPVDPDTEHEKSLPHQRSFSSALNLDINASSVTHLQNLMEQILEQSEVDNVEQWKDVIMQMLLRICHNLKPDVRGGDELDIRHYVKIKRIPGGKISDSHYISGIVASKNATHKKMLKEHSNPLILIVTFPLQYERVENELTSLEPLIAQEREHLRNLVNRILALSPDIVFVQKSVSRIAMDYLLEANVTVIQNVKISLLESIARCAGADIIHSIDKLALQPRMGTCTNVSFKTFLNAKIPGHMRTYMYIDGCEETLGCSLVLRGGTQDTLQRVKRVVDLLVFVVYSLKLETCLLQDEYALTPSVQSEDAKPSLKQLHAETTNLTHRALKFFQHTILSGSPHVQFPPPYLLLKLHAQEQQLTALNNAMPLAPMEVKSATAAKSDLKTKVESAETLDSLRFVDTENTIPLVKAPSSLESRYILANAESLSPFTQQNISVLFSNVCRGNKFPCLPPQSLLIEYYRDSDLTLGQFIEDTCFGSKFPCPVNSCDKTMLSHSRTYAHHTGRISVSVDPLDCPVPGMEYCIMMWSLCKVCQESTPFIPMSEETWKYSFGKYLELTFYRSNVNCRAMTCSHNIHREHIRYFSLTNLTVRIEFEPITLYEVITPPMRRQPNIIAIDKLREDDMNTIKRQISMYYDSVLDRIKGFTFEIVPLSLQTAAREAMVELGKRAASEKKFMLQLLQQAYISSTQLDRLSLNSVYKTLLENVQEWDTEFAGFVAVYLQAESRDIRKVTAAQFKRIFSDRETSEARQTIIAIASDAPNDEIDDYLPIDKSKLPLLGGSPPEFTMPMDIGLPDLQRRISLKYRHDSSNRYIDDTLSIGCSPVPVEDEISEIFRITTDVGYDQEQPSPDQPYPQEIPSEPSSYPDDRTDGIMYPRNLSSRRPPRPRVTTVLSMSIPEHPNLASDEDEANLGTNIFTGVAAETESMHFESLRTPGERTSIMQTISNLWNGNPANFLPLVYPSNPREHIFQESLVIVREDEPSSIISFTLASKQYKEKLHAMRTGVLDSAGPQAGDRFSIDFDDQMGDIEEALLRGIGTHIRYRICSNAEFWDGNTKMHCKIFFAEQFDALRRNCGVDEIFEQSLARCIRWDTSGGKSGSFFLKTRDNWLVVKQLTRSEMDALYKFAPAYFEYMSQAFFHDLPTILAKIFGFYRVGYKNPTTGKTMKMDLLVMENLFYERNISRIFDVKGSMRNRHVQSTGDKNEVLLDENLLECIRTNAVIYESPLFIREHSKKILRASVWNDTLFLSKLNVMDYSLLIGIDNESHEYVIGIVDFIRTYTLDKKLESWVKETGILGGSGKEPTIVTPRQYKNRFRDAMDKYFLMVPEKFASLK